MISKRIYLGGIDPARGLTTEEVLQRLRTRSQEHHSTGPKFQLRDVHVGTCYLQFTIQNTFPHEGEEDALATIKKWFHNVTWKGCKLHVELARPHFLQRLKNEIEQRQQSKTNMPFLENNKTDQELPVTSSDCNPKRYWKVKRGYGKPSLLVDTQPCRVKNWNDWSKMQKKHEQYQPGIISSTTTRGTSLSHSNNNKDDTTTNARKKASYYNRSIHIRLTTQVEDEEDADEKHGYDREEINEIGSSSATVTSCSSSSYSDSESDVQHSPNEGKYIWSDDDDDDDESDMQRRNKEEENLTRIKSEKRSFLKASSSSSSSSSTSTRSHSSDSRGSGDSASWEQNSINDTETANNLTNSNAMNLRKDETWKVQHRLGVDKFDSGMDVDSLLDEHDDDAVKDVDRDSEDENFDIHVEEELETNFRVFAQLFPNLAEQKSAKNFEQTKKDHENQTQKKEGSGWGSTGQMLRFDPNNLELAKQFLLETPSDKEREKDAAVYDDHDDHDHDGNHVEKESPRDDGSEKSQSGSEKSEVKETNAETKKKPDIYEQAKLELVFKQVRESNEQVVSFPSKDAAAPAAAGFFFGFTVDDKNSKSPQKDTFSFSFVTDKTKNGETSISHDRPNESEDAQRSIQDTYSEEQHKEIPRCRPAFHFPQKDLDAFVHNFYHMKEGDRILNDLEGWRNDPEVKERWLRDRARLTQDWKSKRKYALEKKKRRLK
jgi:hypothetical protein